MRGALAALAAAALFGATAPIAKRLLGQLPPLGLAGLLYLGAGFGVTLARLFRREKTREAPLTRNDLPLLAGVIFFGGVCGPALLLFGLARVTAVTGSLLLNLEGLFTVLVAAWLFREHVTWRAGLAAAALLGGATVLGWRNGALAGEWVGLVAIGGACACWALDNNLTQRLSLRDPFAIVSWKALPAGAFNLLFGFALGERLPHDARLLGVALGVGVVGYGLSVVLDVYALRLLGAAREAAYFAAAPFVGALVAMPLLGERLRLRDDLAGLLMAAGVVMLLTERHAHRHTHDATEHEHLHTHDTHHQHEHAPGQDPRAPHSHPHRHEEMTHEHPHVPDAHHRHRH